MFPRRHARALVWKYWFVLGSAVGGALLISGLVDLYFSVPEQTAAITRIEREQVHSAAVQVRQFVAELERQTEGAVPAPGLPPALAAEQRASIYRRLLRQSLPIHELRYIDSAGRERLLVSRTQPDVVDSFVDFSSAPEFQLTRERTTYFGDVYFHKDSEPFLPIGVAEQPPNDGVTVAQVNLKLIWDLVNTLRIGDRGHVYVVDGSGYLVAHRDISLVLSKTNVSSSPQVRAALVGSSPPPGPESLLDVLAAGPVLSAVEHIDPPGWYVLGDQPLEEAFEPVIASLRRTFFLFLWGLGLSALVSYALAQRMVTPIRMLQAGVARIGGGALDQRVEVRSSAELEALAEEFNTMADRLREAYSGLEEQVAERTQELAQANAELGAQARQLELASQHKTEFLKYVAHELRTPLNAITGYSVVLADRLYGPLNEKQEEYLRDILNSAHNQLALINQLLDPARIEHGDIDLEVGTFSLVDALKHGVTMVREAAREGHVALEMEIGPEVGLIEGDEGKVREILENLLSNAVKFTPPGGHITVRAYPRANAMYVEVADDGIGISPEDQARVFDKYFRGNLRAVRDQPGTGLGLNFARQFVERHGGRLWVDSEVGRGSTFTFTLPLQGTTADDGASTAPTGTSQASLEVGARTVLVIDDDPHAVSLVEAILQPQGYQVLAASNGTEGIEIIRGVRPGLVILDLLMPELDGYGVVDQLRADPGTADVPVLVLTAESISETNRARLMGRISQLVQKGDVSWPRLVSLVDSYYHAPGT